MAVERNPEPILALHEAGHEICSHGYRWIDYQYVDESTERAHMEKAIRAIEDSHRRTACRLVYGAHQPQYTQAGHRRRRFPVRRR